MLLYPLSFKERHHSIVIAGLVTPFLQRAVRLTREMYAGFTATALLGKKLHLPVDLLKIRISTLESNGMPSGEDTPFI